MDKPDDVDAIVTAWRRELPGIGATSIGPSTRLRRAARLVQQRRDELLRRLGTDESMVDLLSTLRRSGPPYRLTPGELARASLVTTGAISQRLDRAEAAGLVRRSVDGTDRRRVDVGLTDAGHAEVHRVVAALLAAEDAWWDELLAPLPAADRAALDRALRHLAAVLSAAGRQSGAGGALAQA